MEKLLIRIPWLMRYCPFSLTTAATSWTKETILFLLIHNKQLQTAPPLPQKYSMAWVQEIRRGWRQRRLIADHANVERSLKVQHHGHCLSIMLTFQLWFQINTIIGSYYLITKQDKPNHKILLIWAICIWRFNNAQL